MDIEDFQDLPNQLAIIQLGKRDLAIAKVIQPFFENHMNTIVDNYYNQIQKELSLQKIIEEHSNVERLKLSLRKHLYELFNGVINAEFVNHKNHIARVHVKIGLKSKWFMGAFQRNINLELESFASYFKEIKHSR